LHVVPVGEVERFVPAAAHPGPTRLANVLAMEGHLSELGAAKDFVRSLRL
jgi:hypothetical protein